MAKTMKRSAMGVGVATPATDPLKGIDTESQALQRMNERMALPEDLAKGTPGMLEAATRWLPQEKGEDDAAYETRLQRTVLYETYTDTLDKLSARPFAKDVAIKEAPPEPLQLIETDADYAGNSLSQWARTTFRDGLHRGMVGILVETPEQQAAHLGVQKDRGVHPYLCHIPANTILGFKQRKAADGRMVLTEVRLRETVIVPDGQFGDSEVVQIRVIREGAMGESGESVGNATWFTARKDERGIWGVDKVGTLGVPEIPLVIAYFNKIGPMESAPCLGALAWQCKDHWCTTSSHSNGVHYSQIPILHETGTPTEQVNKPMVIGANRVVRTSTIGATLEYAETTGQALECGRKRLQDIEARMEALSSLPMVQGTAELTATGHVLSDSRSASMLQAWVRSMEAALLEAYRLAAKMVLVNGKPAQLPADFALDITEDAALPPFSLEKVKILIELHREGFVSKLTVLRQVRGVGLLPEDLDLEDELAAREAEGPALGTLFGGGPGGDEPPPAGDGAGDPNYGGAGKQAA